MLHVKGKLKLKEYYQLYFWKKRSYFNITVFTAILFSVVSIDTLSIKPSILAGDWVMALFDWIKYFILGVIVMAIILLMDATFHKESFLEDKEYFFSEEKITIRTKNSENYIFWDEITEVKETPKNQLWETKQRKYFLLPKRFFDNDNQLNEFEGFIKKKLKGKWH